MDKKERFAFISILLMLAFVGAYGWLQGGDSFRDQSVGYFFIAGLFSAAVYLYWRK